MPVTPTPERREQEHCSRPCAAGVETTAGEMVQRLGALSVLLEDLSFALGGHVRQLRTKSPLVLGDECPPLASVGICTQYTHTHVIHIHTHIYITLYLHTYVIYIFIIK